MLIPSLESGGVLISRAVASQVPSALRGLTSVFGMGTGGTLLPSSPEWFQAVAGLRLCCLKLIALSCSRLPALASLVLARGCCTCFRSCCLRVALALLAFALRFALAFARAALPLALAFACTCCFGSLRLPSLSLRLPFLAPLPRFRFGPLFALFSDRFPLPSSSYAPSKLHSEKLTSKTFFSFHSLASAYLLRTKLSTY